MDNEITLEKIDRIVERTGASYEEARNALSSAEGDVIEAIIALEKKGSRGKFEDMNAKISEKSSEAIDKLKEVLEKGNVTRVILEKDGDVLLNLPVTIGALGLILAPIAAMIGVSAAVFAKYKIKIVKDDGEVVDLNDITEEKICEMKEKMSFGKKSEECSEEEKAEEEKKEESEKE